MLYQFLNSSNNDQCALMVVMNMFISRDRWVLLDSSLSIWQHNIAKVASTCFFHLRRLRRLRRVLDLQNRKRLVCAFVLKRIDHCNAVLANLPDTAHSRVLHAAARFMADLGPRDHVTSILVSLHWLPIRQRITYKLCIPWCILCFTVWLQCIYLTLLLQLHISRAVLTYDQRKMETTILHVYFLVLVSVRSFLVSGPDAWNRVSRELRGIAIASTFKRHLKAELFSRPEPQRFVSWLIYPSLSTANPGTFSSAGFYWRSCLMLFISIVLLLLFATLFTLICLHC